MAGLSLASAQCQTGLAGCAGIGRPSWRGILVFPPFPAEFAFAGEAS